MPSEIITRRTAGAAFLAAALVIGGVLGSDVTKDSKGDDIVDCFGVGPFGLPDGGPRWNGCAVLPVDAAVGNACILAPCSALAGDAAEVKAKAQRGKAPPRWTSSLPAEASQVAKDAERAAAQRDTPGAWECVMPDIVCGRMQ